MRRLPSARWMVAAAATAATGQEAKTGLAQSSTDRLNRASGAARVTSGVPGCCRSRRTRRSREGTAAAAAQAPPPCSQPSASCRPPPALPTTAEAAPLPWLPLSWRAFAAASPLHLPRRRPPLTPSTAGCPLLICGRMNSRDLLKEITAWILVSSVPSSPVEATFARAAAESRPPPPVTS